MSVAVYALVPARAPLSRRGLRLVTAGSVAAVVGRPRPRAAAAADLRAYDTAIRAIARQVPAVLPARFNTVVADDDEIATILRLRQAAFRRALARVRNRVQMTVRLPAGRTSPAVGRKNAGRDLACTGRATTGAGYLRARAEAQRIPEFDPLRASVARWIREERVELRAGIATVYHLVPAGTVGAYRRALLDAAAATQQRLVVTGPFPPYAFAEGW